MKLSDFRLQIDFRALLVTHLRIIHELGAVNQKHEAWNRHGSKVLKVRRIL